MTDIEALEFLKEHRRILAEEVKAGTLINYDINAFDVAITILEERALMSRHKMTDYECIKKIRDLVDATAWDDDDDFKFRKAVVAILMEYDNKDNGKDPVITAMADNSKQYDQRPRIDFSGTNYDI